MPRHRKPKIFTAPGWQQAIRVEFLEFARQHGSPALRMLATEVNRDRMTVHQWATSFSVAGTWLEKWAEDTIAAWDSPARPQPVFEGGQLVEISYLPPRDNDTAKPAFSCTVSGTFISRRAHRITFGGTPWFDKEPEDDRKQFQKKMHEQLDGELDRFFENAGNERTLPEELSLKLEVTALYLLCSKTSDDIAKDPGVSAVSKTVSRWIKDTLDLLELPAKPPGRPRKKISH